MSGIAPEMENAEEITREQILNRLFEENTKEFHTEINAPHGMTTYDVAASLARDEFGDEFADMIESWADRFRTNMVAHQRKRAKELVEALKAEMQREEKRLQDKMVGQLGR